jgi:hypothetical protein
VSLAVGRSYFDNDRLRSVENWKSRIRGRDVRRICHNGYGNLYAFGIHPNFQSSNKIEND